MAYFDLVDIYRADLGLQAALCAVILAGGVITWCGIRRNHEPARKGVNWLYAAMALCFLANLFGAVNYGLYLWPTRRTGPIRELVQYLVPQQRVGVLADFFRALGACAVLTCLAGMAAGICRFLDERRAHIYYTLIGAAAIVAAILALTVLSGRQWLLSMGQKDIAYEDMYKYWRVYDSIEDVEAAMKQLAAVVDIMLLAISVAVVVWVWTVVTQARNAAGGLKMLDRAVDLLIVASLLNLVPSGFRMVQVVWTLGHGTPRSALSWYSVTNVVLDHVITVVVLSLLCAVACRKVSSLWRSPQG